MFFLKMNSVKWNRQILKTKGLHRQVKKIWAKSQLLCLNRSVKFQYFSICQINFNLSMRIVKFTENKLKI